MKSGVTRLEEQTRSVRRVRGGEKDEGSGSKKKGDEESTRVMVGLEEDRGGVGQ